MAIGLACILNIIVYGFHLNNKKLFSKGNNGRPSKLVLILGILTTIFKRLDKKDNG